jgi:hypothetical protein
MTTATLARPTLETLADLVQRLGDIPLERIRLRPPPGTATEADVLISPDGVKRLCELVDGVLVEKPMGYYESRLALILAQWLLNFLDQHDLGIVTGESGPLRLDAGLVRMPDVAFLAWEQFPKRLDTRGGREHLRRRAHRSRGRSRPVEEAGRQVAGGLSEGREWLAALMALSEDDIQGGFLVPTTVAQEHWAESLMIYRELGNRPASRAVVAVKPFARMSSATSTSTSSSRYSSIRRRLTDP